MCKGLVAAFLPALVAPWVLPFAASAGKGEAPDGGKFLTAMAKDERIPHALNRLTFGARPGDAEQVGAVGLKKWIELQLQPEGIPENPALAEKLKMMDSLGLSGEDLVRRYPDPQMVRQMMSGQIPFATDPDQRMMVRKLVARMEARQGQ